MKKLVILFIGVMTFALTGCCGLHGGGGGCATGNCGTGGGFGPVGYNGAHSGISSAAVPAVGPATVTAPTPYHRAAMSTPIDTLPTY